MAQLSDDCFAFGGKLMTAQEAMDTLSERLSVVVEPEQIGLRAALGRILAEDVRSERAVPPHDNAAVDGYAVRFDDLDPNGETMLTVSGRVAAGHPLGRATQPGEAIRIFTGAPMPDGPDTVLMQEDCRVDDDRVIIPPGIKRGANRRRAGED
ncbi:MAG: molybdopterin molybdenumtransferase MoeA, partial [Rhodospirillales bacterium]|nr:molybdopterin molybdenumtransferase MoeA [Rhodospirillales bacterium]